MSFDNQNIVHSITFPPSNQVITLTFTLTDIRWDGIWCGIWYIKPFCLRLTTTNCSNNKIFNKWHRHHNKNNKKAISIQPTKLESCERNEKRFKDSSKLLKFFFAKLWQSGKIQFGRDKKCITQIIYFMIVCQSYCSRFVLFAILRFVGW